MEPHPKPPPAVRYRMLSLVWCFPSLGALWLLGTGMSNWRLEQGILEGMTRVRVEEWIAVLLLGFHILWLTQWWRANR